jgi:hypothetical protein
LIFGLNGIITLILGDSDGLDEMSQMMPSKLINALFINRSLTNDGPARNGVKEFPSNLQK